MPGVYANVTNYYDWIEEQVYNNAPTIKPYTERGQYPVDYRMSRNVTCPAESNVEYRFRTLDTEPVNDFVVLEYGSQVKS